MRWKLGWYALVGLLLVGSIWLAVRALDTAEMWATLRNARWGYLLPSTLLGILTYMLLAYRWQRILHNRPTFIDTFSAFQIGVYANIVLPLRVGDITRSWLIQRRNPAFSILTVLTSIGTGLLLDVSSMLVILPLVLIFFPLPPLLTVASLLVLGIAIILGGLALWLARQQGDLPVPRAEWLIQGLQQVRQGVSILDNNLETMRLVALTLLAYGIQGVANWWLLLALQEDVQLAAGFIAMVGAAVGLAVPLLPGSVGTYEVAIAVALTSAGVEAETATVAALLFRGQQTVIIVLLGSLFMLREGVGLAELRQWSEEKKTLPQQGLDLF